MGIWQEKSNKEDAPMTLTQSLALTGSLILGLGLAAPALAQSIDRRQENQQQRIANGIRMPPTRPSSAPSSSPYQGVIRSRF